MLLARVALALDAADRCFISPRRLTLLFVTGDVFAFFIVGGGECDPLDLPDVPFMTQESNQRNSQAAV